MIGRLNKVRNPGFQTTYLLLHSNVCWMCGSRWPRSAIFYLMKRVLLNQSILILFFCSVWSFINWGCGKPANKASEERSSKSPAASASRDDRPVIAALGDSLTSGAGVDPDKNYPAKLQKMIDADGYRYRVVNAGVSGDTSDQGLGRIQSVIGLHPAIVIVELGANDGLRGLPAEVTRQNLAAIVQQLQSEGAKIVLAGMQVPPNYGPQYTTSFRNIFKDISRQYHVPLIPFFLEGVGGNPALNQDDGIHPTADGYDIVVKNVWNVLKPLL
jgi:acyl-CoA thioesterase I